MTNTTIKILEYSMIELLELITLISNFFPPLNLHNLIEPFHILCEIDQTIISYVDLGNFNSQIFEISWEYFEFEKWTKFDPKVEEIIESAFKQKNKTVKISISDEIYEFHLDTMKYNKITEELYTRIRRSFQTKPNDSYDTNIDPRSFMLQDSSFFQTSFVISLVLQIRKNVVDDILAHKSILLLSKIVEKSEPAFLESLIESTLLFETIQSFMLTNSSTMNSCVTNLIIHIINNLGHNISQSAKKDKIFESCFYLVDKIYFQKFTYILENVPYRDYVLHLERKNKSDLARKFNCKMKQLLNRALEDGYHKNVQEFKNISLILYGKSNNQNFEENYISIEKYFNQKFTMNGKIIHNSVSQGFTKILSYYHIYHPNFDISRCLKLYFQNLHETNTVILF